MPRPKPPEQLFPATYRLTRTQIRKVSEMGGVAWLRELIAKTQKSKAGRDPQTYIQQIKARNESIAADNRPSKEVAAAYKLSAIRVNAIRRQYRGTQEVNP